MKYLALLTRCRDEFYIQEFCDYYLSQGVDKIYIIDDDSEDKSIYDFSKIEKYKSVEIKYSSRMYANKSTTEYFSSFSYTDEPNKLYNKIKNQYEWLIYVDVDEFIVTKKNFDKTIREELKDIDKNHDYIQCISIPWVFMSGANLENNPKSVLKSILYRHDNNKKHPHPVSKFRCRSVEIECKSIFKPSAFSHIQDHGPNSKDSYNGVDLTKNRLKVKKGFYFFSHLRENDVKNGVFLCYHYRYISDENSKNKLKNNGWYINDKFSFNDLKTSSYPEIYDNSMLKKLL